MGYRGKLRQQEAARRLRSKGYTLNEIVRALGVSKSSVSLWVRDVEFTPRLPLGNRNHGVRRRSPNALERRKAEEIERLRQAGYERVGRMSEREFLVAGIALYAGEGAKTDGNVKFANSDPRMIAIFLAWLRHFFEIDESRLRLRLYLHQGLDLEAANRFWADVTRVPREQFGKPYRAVPDPSIRKSKHPMGCPSVNYACSRTHRAIMGLIGALLSLDAIPG